MKVECKTGIIEAAYAVEKFGKAIDNLNSNLKKLKPKKIVKQGSKYHK